MNYFKLCLTILLFVYIGYSGIYKTWGVISNDFSNYYVSSQIIVNESDLTILYNDSLFNKYVNKYDISQESKFSQYPPLTSFIMIPLTVFDPIAAKNGWTIINIGFLLGCVILSRKLFSLTWLDSFFSYSILGFGIINNFVFAQFYIILLFLVLVSLWLLKKDHIIIPSMLLGFSIVVKIIPFVLLVWLIFHKKWKLITLSILTISFLLLFEIAFFGWSISSNFWLGIFTDHLQSNLIHQSPYAFSFQSLNTLLHHLFVFNLAENPIPVIDSHFLFLTGMIGVPVILLFIILLHLRKNPFHKRTEILDESFVIFFVGFLCILPATATYHFILLAIPSAIILSSSQFSNHAKFLLLLPVFLIGFIPINRVSSLNLDGFFFILHFPRLILLFVLFALLISNSRRRNLNEQT